MGAASAPTAVATASVAAPDAAWSEDGFFLPLDLAAVASVAAGAGSGIAIGAVGAAGAAVALVLRRRDGRAFAISSSLTSRASVMFLVDSFQPGNRGRSGRRTCRERAEEAVPQGAGQARGSSQVRSPVFRSAPRGPHGLQGHGKPFRRLSRCGTPVEFLLPFDRGIPYGLLREIGPETWSRQPRPGDADDRDRCGPLARERAVFPHPGMPPATPSRVGMERYRLGDQAYHTEPD